MHAITFAYAVHSLLTSYVLYEACSFLSLFLGQPAFVQQTHGANIAHELRPLRGPAAMELHPEEDFKYLESCSNEWRT